AKCIAPPSPLASPQNVDAAIRFAGAPPIAPDVLNLDPPRSAGPAACAPTCSLQDLQPLRADWRMADKDKKKIDPYAVDALEKSLNDSATRVSTIWISFLLFALYLVTAAGTVTHRQLFLEEPTRLPVLNIDLPLWWFFLLAPIFFVILHAYVLMQV